MRFWDMKYWSRLLACCWCTIRANYYFIVSWSYAARSALATGCERDVDNNRYAVCRLRLFRPSNADIVSHKSSNLWFSNVW